MKLTANDNYLTMIELLAGLVKRHLTQPVQKPACAIVDERTLLLVNAILEQEDDEKADWELTAELLGSWEFKKIA
jgi:hypothetical protein